MHEDNKLRWCDVCLEDELRRAVNLLAAAGELWGCDEVDNELGFALADKVLFRLREISSAYQRSES